MSALDVTDTANARDLLVQGIYDLAAFLDENPSVPLPHVWAITWSHHKTGAADFKAACEVMLPLGATVADKRHTDKSVVVALSFGPVELSVEIEKDKIGEKRQTVRKVTEYVLPEWARRSEAVSP